MDDCIVGVALELDRRNSDAALQLHIAPLLHHVRGFVRSGVDVGLCVAVPEHWSKRDTQTTSVAARSFSKDTL